MRSYTSGIPDLETQIYAVSCPICAISPTCILRSRIAATWGSRGGAEERLFEFLKKYPSKKQTGTGVLSFRGIFPIDRPYHLVSSLNQPNIHISLPTQSFDLTLCQQQQSIKTKSGKKQLTIHLFLKRCLKTPIFSLVWTMPLPRLDWKPSKSCVPLCVPPVLNYLFTI